MNRTSEALTSLLGWVKTNAPGLCRTINPALSPEELSKFEADLGFSLPEVAASVYLTLNGQPAWGEALFPSLAPGLGSLIVMESSTVVSVRRDRLAFMRDVPAIEQMPFAGPQGIRRQYWNPRWLPFASDGGAGMLVFDFDPEPNGRFGQIFAVWDDTYERVLVAGCLSELVDGVMSGIEAGRFCYKEGYGVGVR